MIFFSIVFKYTVDFIQHIRFFDDFGMYRFFVFQRSDLVRDRHARESVQPFDRAERIGLVRTRQRTVYVVREFIRRRRGNYYRLRRIARFRQVIVIGADGYGGMRIQQIIVRFKEIVYRGRRIIFGSRIAFEQAEFVGNAVEIYLIHSETRQFFHLFFYEAGISAAHFEQQPFQIGADQDIHRRRHRLAEGAVGIVFAVREKFRQHVVGVAGDYQLPYRQAHFIRIISGENVSEIAGRHHEIYLVAHIYLFGADKVEVRRNVINDLRSQPSPIYGVRGRQRVAHFRKLGFAFGIGENTFDSRLRVVEVAFYAYDVSIGTRRRLHLQFLQFADALRRIKNDYFGAFDVLETFQSRLAGVA